MKLKTYDDPTKGDFCGGEMICQLYFEDKHDVGWKKLNSPIDTIQLDANFSPTVPFKIRGIPQYILNGDTTKFITYQQARQIIKDQFSVNRDTLIIQEHYMERIFVPYLELYPEPIIEYRTKLLFENNTLRHHWQVIQIIRCGEVVGYIESIESKYMKKYGHLYETKDLQRLFYLDAMTGEILYDGDFNAFEFSPSM